MRWVGVRRAPCVPKWRLLRSVLSVLILAATAAGCSSNVQSGRMAPFAVSASSATTVAFESIDGPPPEVFRKLVARLNEEADARRIVVVSRASPANYRVRGYVSALVEGDKTSYAWVWDVYDTDKRRALRIGGEVPAAGRPRNAWSGADDRVLRSMARNGMDRIAIFLDATARSPAAVPAPNLVTLVSARDDTPEAAGIFRLFEPPTPPGDTAPPPDAAEAEATKPQPQPKAGRTRATAGTTGTRAAELAPRP